MPSIERDTDDAAAEAQLLVESSTNIDVRQSAADHVDHRGFTTTPYAKQADGEGRRHRTISDYAGKRLGVATKAEQVFGWAQVRWDARRDKALAENNVRPYAQTLTSMRVLRDENQKPPAQHLARVRRQIRAKGRERLKRGWQRSFRQRENCADEVIKIN